MHNQKTPVYDQPCDLVIKTQDLLKADHRSLPDIFKETGIPFYWLRNFACGRYKKNPSINRVVYLYEYLTGKPLEL